MKKVLILIPIFTFLIPCFAFAQSDEISTTKFLQSLPNRVNYIEYSAIHDRDTGYFYSIFESREDQYQIVQSIKFSGEDRFGLMRRIGDVYYWIPSSNSEYESSLFELPDGRQLEFGNNQKPLVESEGDNNFLIDQLKVFRDDYYEFRSISRKIEWRSKSDETLTLLTGITLSGVSVLAFTSNQRLFKDVGNTTLGIITSTLSITSLISFVQNKIKYKNLDRRRNQLLRKYN